ncbi:MAG TPA: hypothetical protein VF081_12325 [Solirubrobacterales bacterium]
MRRFAAVLSVLAALALPAAAGASQWHSEQPVAAGAGVPVPLGPVGDIEFWAPNRGMLITEGNGGMPAGVYAYDGSGWHLYSTVCGGHEGRIAWAGPTEFWTISDQRLGQEDVVGENQEFQFFNRSLCHFKEGKVVASYAEPLGLETTFSRINAAACNGPDDCWFGGDRLPGTINAGAFHLHWNGLGLAAVPSLTAPQPELADPARAVRDLAFHAGRFYESVQVAAADGEIPGEPDPQQPSFLHGLDPASATPFAQLFTPQPLQYGTGVSGRDLGAFRFTELGGRLWAIAGAAGEAPAQVTAVRLQDGVFSQVSLSDPGSTFTPSDRVSGVAAEPGAGRIWVSFRHAGGEGNGILPARLTAIGADGTVEAATLLPAEPGGTHRGSAGPIACSAVDQCWMATGRGWLFHLGDALPQDTDPAMHTLIAERPCDGSCPAVPPAELPIDDSGSELPVPEQAGDKGRESNRKAHRLVVGVKQRVLDGNVLELSFTLKATAHVQLLARRSGHVVAKTPRQTMGKGRHSLRLRLDPDRWPTNLDFKVRPVSKRGAR